MKTKIFLAGFFLVFSMSVFSQTHQLKGLVKDHNETAAFYDIRLIANDTVYSSTDENVFFLNTSSRKFLQPTN